MAEILDWSDLETQLQEVKELLANVEQRLQQVSQGAIAKQELSQQQAQLKAELQDLQNEQVKDYSKIRRKPNSKYASKNINQNPRIEEIHRQLLEISDRLEQLEAEIESRLLSWSSFSEPFWQIVRFTGLGIVIGIILRSCAG